MSYTRISPGIYRDDATGKTVRTPNGQPPGTNASTPAKPGTGAGTSSGKGLLGTNTPNINFSDPNQVGEAGLNFGAKTSVINNQTTNADYQGFGGGQSTTIDPNTGKATTNYNLSNDNKQILGKQQQAGDQSYNLINSFLNSPGDDPSNPLNALQKSTYNRLTGAGQASGLDQTYQQNKEQLTQSLANRGIPVGSDLYNNQMKQLEEGYSNSKQNAQDSAYQSSFSQIPTLSGIGQSGYIDPKTGQVAAFQGNAFQGPSASDIYGTFQGGQNVAGTNATNKIIGAGHDQASVDSAGVAGKYALLGKLTDAGNPTFQSPPTYYPTP